jgi:hypothetical protein
MRTFSSGAPTRRIEQTILAVQTNLACTYQMLGRDEQALQLEGNVYHESLRLLGEEDRDTLLAANNYAASLVQLKRFGEAKSLLLKRMPVARRVLGESDDLTIKMRWTYAKVTYKGDGATLSDLCEAVATLAETEQTARRVLGGAHPLTGDIGICLRQARAAQAATLEQEK